MLDVGRSLLILGIAIATLGAAAFVLARLGWRGLPGDLTYRTQHFQILFPIGSCLALSILLTLGLWLSRWFTR